MKGINNQREFTKADINRFLVGTHVRIVGCIIIIGFSTLIKAPVYFPIIFTLLAFYRIFILNLYQTKIKEAWENEKEIVEYLNEIKAKKEQD